MDEFKRRIKSLESKVEINNTLIRTYETILMEIVNTNEVLVDTLTSIGLDDLKERIKKLKEDAKNVPKKQRYIS